MLKAGIAELENPAEFGVLFIRDGGLTLARPAPRRAHRLFATWMALARAAPEGAAAG